MGTKFTPKGQPNQYNESEKPQTSSTADTIDIDPESNRKIDFPDSKLNATADEQQAMAYVRALMHEASHAYRAMKGLHGSGLAGQIADEKNTRLLERKMLGQIAKATPSKGIKAEAADYIARIGSGVLQNKDVARSLVSGDGITYLEKYYVDEALGPLLAAYEGDTSSAVAVLAGLKHPSLVSPKTAAAFHDALLALIPEASLPQSKGPTGPPKGPKGPEPSTRLPISPATRELLVEILSNDKTTKELTEILAQAGKFAAEEQPLLHYALLLKAYEAKVSLKAEHEKASAHSGTDEANDLLDALAEKYLGRVKPYEAL
jgi:hypothetical protein